MGILTEYKVRHNIIDYRTGLVSRRFVDVLRNKKYIEAGWGYNQKR